MRENKRYKAVELDEQGNVIPGTDTILWHSRSMAVTCVIKTDKGNFLVEKRGPGCPDNIGKYVFPCGYLSWDETLKQAAIREVYEETGLRLFEKNLEFLGINDKVTENRQNVTVRFMAVVNEERLLQSLSDGTVNTDTKSRGGEDDECESLELFSIDYIEKHADEFAFGHDELAKVASNK